MNNLIDRSERVILSVVPSFHKVPEHEATKVVLVLVLGGYLQNPILFDKAGLASERCSGQTDIDLGIFARGGLEEGPPLLEVDLIFDSIHDGCTARVVVVLDKELVKLDLLNNVLHLEQMIRACSCAAHEALGCGGDDLTTTADQVAEGVDHCNIARGIFKLLLNIEIEAVQLQVAKWTRSRAVLFGSE